MKKVKRSIEDYKELLYLPHHVSSNKAPMPISKRAAQFSPFSAVVGHEVAVKEAARYTSKKKTLDEMEMAIIDETLRMIESNCKKYCATEVVAVYFESDSYKEGGQYLTKTGYVKKIDVYNQDIYFTDGSKINIEDVYSIDIQ
jgi:hypothetical protein